MKRKGIRYRGLAFPVQFVRSVEYCYPTLLRFPPGTRQPSVRARKTFIIREWIRARESDPARALPASNDTTQTIQRILVFDDHPDSLRLVLGQSARPKTNRTSPRSERWWEPMLGGILIAAALILMFLPLFLKLRS